jgi:hypothetical protein
MSTETAATPATLTDGDRTGVSGVAVQAIDSDLGSSSQPQVRRLAEYSPAQQRVLLALMEQGRREK